MDYMAFVKPGVYIRNKNFTGYFSIVIYPNGIRITYIDSNDKNNYTKKILFPKRMRDDVKKLIYKEKKNTDAVMIITLYEHVKMS